MLHLVTTSQTSLNQELSKMGLGSSNKLINKIYKPYKVQDIKKKKLLN